MRVFFSSYVAMPKKAGRFLTIGRQHVSRSEVVVIKETTEAYDAMI